MDNELIEYISIINSNVNIESINNYKDITCSINVEEYIEPVEYIAIINSYLYNPNNSFRYNLDSNLNIDKNYIYDEGLLDDIESKLNILEFKAIYGFISTLDLNYLKYELDLNSSFNYSKEIYNMDLDCNVIFKAFYDEDILDSSCNIDLEKTELYLDSDLQVNNLLGYKDLNTTLNLMRIPSFKNLIYGNLKYEKDSYEYLLDGDLELAEFMYSVYIQSRIKVIRKQYYYSVFSRIKVVDGVNKDIKCSITVFNDQIYDIFSDVDMLPISGLYDIMNDCSLYMQDYIISDIDCNFILDHTWTRKDIPIYMYVVHGIDKEIECSFDVFNPSYKYSLDIPCSFISSMNIMYEDISSSISVKSVNWINKDIISRICISNRLAPAKIGIVVDPLWKYEPFIIQATLVTFFDRITTKNELSIVYGGNPRSDWDIEHYAKVFGIDKDHMLKSPIIYDPRDRNKIKNSVFCYINNLFNFNPDNNNYCNKVDRVFIFTNKAEYSTSIQPIINICKQNKIPCLAINSQGDYFELVKWWEDNPCHPHLSIHNPSHPPRITY